MARKYDRMIRFYASWFADLNDEEKALTPSEKWQVVEAIVSSQLQQTTDPLTALPLEIRRALSMATMREQLERVLERNQGARDRGLKGAQERYKQPEVEPQPPSLFDGSEGELTPPLDGKERNWDGLLGNLHQWNIRPDLIAEIAKLSNFGEIGHPIWTANFRLQQTNIKDKNAYLEKCLLSSQK